MRDGADVALHALQIGRPGIDGFIDSTDEFVEDPSGTPQVVSTPYSPFDKIPNELILHIIMIAAEDDPLDYTGPQPESGPSLGPYAASASLVCRLWFNLTRICTATRHLWHYGVWLDWIHRDNHWLPVFQQRLTQSRGHDIYVSFFWFDDANDDLPLLHIAAASLQILWRYRHQVASMKFGGSYRFIASYLSSFTASCERLHTIRIDGEILDDRDDRLSYLYTWRGLVPPFWSLTHLDIVGDDGELDLSLLPSGPNLKRLTLRPTVYQDDPVITVKSAALVSFMLANPRLEDLNVDLELDEAASADRSNLNKSLLKIKALYIISGPMVPLFMLNSFQFDGLTLIKLKRRQSLRHLEDAVPDICIPTNSLPSLKRAIIYHPSLWKPLAAMFVSRGLNYLEIGDITNTSGPLPCLAAPKIKLEITLDMEKLTEGFIFIRHFRVPALEMTETLKVTVSYDNELAVGNENKGLGELRLSSNQPKTIMPLLSILEISLLESHPDIDLVVFQRVLDGIDAPILRSVSLFLFDEGDSGYVHSKIIISAYQTIWSGAGSSSHQKLTQSFNSAHCLQSMSSADVRLELYDNSRSRFRWHEEFSDSFAWLSHAAIHGFSLLHSIKLLTVCFPRRSWNEIRDARCARKVVRMLQSVITAKIEVGSPIHSVVVTDENGTVDWEAPIIDEETDDDTQSDGVYSGCDYW
jgi:hypothetical protein